MSRPKPILGASWELVPLFKNRMGVYEERPAAREHGISCDTGSASLMQRRGPRSNHVAKIIWQFIGSNKCVFNNGLACWKTCSLTYSLQTGVFHVSIPIIPPFCVPLECYNSCRVNRHVGTCQAPSRPPPAVVLHSLFDQGGHEFCCCFPC